MFYSRIGKFNGKCLVVVVVGLNGQVLTKIVPCLLRSRLASLCFRSLVMDLERERSKSKISFPQGTETSLSISFRKALELGAKFGLFPVAPNSTPDKEQAGRSGSSPSVRSRPVVSFN